MFPLAKLINFRLVMLLKECFVWAEYFRENRTTRLGDRSTHFLVFCQKIILANTSDRCRDVIPYLFMYIFCSNSFEVINICLVYAN